MLLIGYQTFWRKKKLKTKNMEYKCGSSKIAKNTHTLKSTQSEREWEGGREGERMKKYVHKRAQINK